MKINRKKFFLTFAGTSFLGFSFIKSLPSRVVGEISGFKNGKLQVKINPLAVSRKSRGEKSV